MQEKRKDYIGWDAYFMGIAMLSAQRSKDPNTQVGACIVSKDKKILSVGYNGAPNGYDDKHMPWDREGDFMNTKYAYVCHAELNAIFPCNECAKAIIQCGIKEIVYKSDKYNGTDGNIVSKKMLDYCGVTYRKYEESNKEIKLEL